MKKNQGFTLLETLIATAIVLVSVAAIFALGSQSFLAANQSADSFTAAFLATEGVEIVRGLRDNNWLAGSPWDQGLAVGTYIADYNDQALSPFLDIPLRLSTSGFFQYDTGASTKFKRQIKISNKTADSLVVTVTVSWGGGQMQVSDQLWNWK